MKKVLSILMVNTSEAFVQAQIKHILNFGFELNAKRVEDINEIKAELLKNDWDCIISEYGLKKFSALEILQIINQAELEVPLIVVIDDDIEIAAIEAMKSGVRDYVLKSNLKRLGAIIYREIIDADIRKEYKRYQNELIQEKDRLAATLSSIGDGVIVTDASGNISMMNEAAELLTGYKHSHAIGRALQEIFNIYDKTHHIEADSLYNRILEKKNVVGLKQHTVLISSDGMGRDISASGAPIKDYKGRITGIVIVFRDISLIKKAEEKISTEQKNFEAVFYEAPIGMLILDENCEIKNANRAIENMMKVQMPEIVGSRIGNGIACINSAKSENGCGYSIECYKCKLRSAIEYVWKANNPIYGLEIQHTRKSGKYEHNVWYRISSQPISLDGKKNIMITLDDITSQKHLQDAVQESERRYRGLFESASDIVFIYDTRGNIKSINKAGEEMLGYTKEELTSMNILEFLVPEFLDSNTDINKRMNQLNLERQMVEIDVLNKVNENITLEVNRQIIYNEGVQEGIQGIARDISKRKRIEAELQRAKDEAEAANIAKSEFLANMSHEIRTPMNGMTGMLDLLMLTDLDIEQKEYLDIVKSSMDTLLRVLNDILDFSKIEAGKLMIKASYFNLTDLIEKLIKAYNLKALEKGLTLKHWIPKDIPSNLVGDSLRLKQILNNLIGNAIKFTDYGDVEFRAEKINQTQEHIEIMFTIKDTGIGISEEDKTKLFKSFSQVESSFTRRYSGSGLGLAITKRLVEIMGGKIWVESEKNSGSTFYFSLNFAISKEALEDKVQIKAYNNYTTGRVKRILVVEDNKMNQVTISSILQKSNYSFEIANNGREALNIIGKKNFDIVLMDIQMPEMDGIQATKKIRHIEKHTKEHIPIIATTAYALQGDAERFLSQGMDFYVSKPINREELLNAIEKASNLSDNIKEGKEFTLSHTADASYKSKEDYETEDRIHRHIYELDKIKEDLVRLGDAIKIKNYVLIEQCAHRIKEATKQIYLDELKKLAFKIELSARKGKLEDIIKKYKQLTSEIESI